MTTTENSRADALTIPRDLLNDLIEDVQSFADQVPCREREKAFRADLLARARAFAGSPSLQPAAAPIDSGTVSVACFSGSYPRGTITYGQPAPSPADERAAFAVLSRLHGEVFNLPRRREPLGGQTFAYVKVHEVVDLIEDAMKQARAASATKPADKRAGRVSLSLTHEQVSALYVHLVHRNRPEFGWIESPLVAIEEALKPAHNAIHDRGFNAMNRQFFGDDRFKFDEAEMPSEIVPQARAASANETDDYETRRKVAEALGIVWPGTRDGKRIGYAWSYLLGCIKDACANETGAEGAKCCKRQMDNGDPVEPQCYECEERAICKRDESRSPAMAVEAVAIPNSPAYCLRGLYKPADEYFIDGKPCTPDEYIAWQAGIIEAVTKAKLPDPKYYGGSAEEGDQHDVKCAYVDGWNDCRASILAAPQPPAQADARGEDAYVAKRLSEVLASVYATLIGDDQVDENDGLNAIQRCERAAQVLRLEVELYRGQADARVGLTDEQILSIAEKHHASHPGVDEWWEFRDRADVIAFARALLATPQPEPRAEVTEEQPSLTNPLTPYGMLVRALRIVSGTTLMDMAEHLGRGPAELSAIEFGRKPVRDADIVDAAHFFACAGIQSTTHALTIAARAGGQHADQA